MAKFFVTNNQQYYKSLKEQIGNTNFQISFDYAEEGLYSIAVHKIGMHNQNAVQKGNNFCIATGTCIYNESLNYTTLLQDFSGDITLMREKTLGQYAVSIYKDNKLTVFGDACGCYDIFYFQDSSKRNWMVSNSLYDMVKAIGHENVTLDEFSIIERTLNRSLLNGETFFHEIYRLRGTQYLSIDIGKQMMCVPKIEVEFPVIKDMDEAVEKAANAYRENARIAAKVLGTPTICATGGLDSRILIAAFLSIGVKPILLYGVGNNKVSSPQKEDEYCVEQFRRRLGLKVIKTDFSISNPIDKDWDEYINNFGFLPAFIWGGQKHIINSLQLGTKFKLFGWGGGTFT